MSTHHSGVVARTITRLAQRANPGIRFGTSASNEEPGVYFTHARNAVGDTQVLNTARDVLNATGWLTATVLNSGATEDYYVLRTVEVPPTPRRPTVLACRYYALCNYQADGTTAHPILGPVPTCQRCADKHALTLTPFA